MIETNNTFSGANFSYTNEKNCTATGDFRSENGKLAKVDISGQLTKSDAVYNFWATRDMEGNINITGVPVAVLAPIASEVVKIVSEVEAIANPQ